MNLEANKPFFYNDVRREIERVINSFMHFFKTTHVPAKKNLFLDDSENSWTFLNFQI